MGKTVVLIDGGKTCSTCGVWKPISEYHSANRDRKHKHSAKCKHCHAEYTKTYRLSTMHKCETCDALIQKDSKHCVICAKRTQEYLDKYRATCKKNRRKNLCVDCGAEIDLRSKRCKKCSNSGVHNAQWKGGVTILKERIRDLFEYRQWRSDVFTRDRFSCTCCGYEGNKLQAHHIVPMNVLMQKYEITTINEALDCDELWNINNGSTLCKSCHLELHKKEGYTHGKFCKY